MSQHDTLTLRDALRSIQYDAATLADAQVIALQALNATYPARAALSATQPVQAAQSVPGVNKAVQLIPGMTKERFAYVHHCALEVDAAKAETARLLAENAALKAQAAQSEPKRCEHCDDTGDVTSIDGHWRGYCTCPHGKDAQGAGEVVRDYYQELLTARGAVQELEQKVFSQEQAIAILRTCVASHQRDMADPPAYLQDAVIKAAGLGAMAEQIAELKRQATHTPTQPAAGADVRDAQRYRWLRAQDNEDFAFAVVKNPHFDVYESPEELDAAIDAAIAASGRNS